MARPLEGAHLDRTVPSVSIEWRHRHQHIAASAVASSVLLNSDAHVTVMASNVGTAAVPDVESGWVHSGKFGARHLLIVVVL